MELRDKSDSGHFKGEAELFKEIYVTYIPELVATAARYVDTIMAEDLVQDLFLKVWNQRLFMCVKTSELKYFLFASLRNACLDALKHEEVKQGYADYYKNRIKLEILSCTEQPFYYEGEEDRVNELFKEINRLPPKCRDIFLDSYVNGKKASEIAQERAISQRTVEAQLYKALKILRDAFALIVSFFLFLSK